MAKEINENNYCIIFGGYSDKTLTNRLISCFMEQF